MAEEDRKGDRKHGGGPPQLAIAGFTIGELTPVAGGEFEASVTAVIRVGGEPPRENVTFQYLVSGRPQNPGQLVNVEGQATDTIRLSGKSPQLAIQLRWRHGMQLVNLRTIPLPKQSRKIEPLGTVRRGDHLEVVLRRIGTDGRAEAGPIACWDFEPVEEGEPIWMLLNWRQRAGREHIAVLRPLLATRRSVVFFLPDDRNVSVVVVVPEEIILPAKPAVPPGQPKGLLERLSESFQHGRGDGRSRAQGR